MVGLGDIRCGLSQVAVERRDDGALVLRSPLALGEYPSRLTDRLEHWARVAPQRTFLAQRRPDGGWRSLDYAQTLARVRNLAQALLDRPLSPERPIVILSGNDIEHALLGLAAYMVGVPYAPISPAYSLVSTDFAKLRAIVGLLTPGLVFVAEGRPFAPALAAVLSPDCELVVTRDPPPGRAATLFADIAATQATAALADAQARVGPDTVAKILFTSGSTGNPKGVINTQLMLCSNQAMNLACYPGCGERPPVLVDWMPWNHTAGGNNNFGLALFNGGTYHIDGGKPTAAGVVATLANLREVAPTIHFNVPKGYEALVPHLRADPALRDRFFSRLEVIQYAGAGLSQHVWDALTELAVAARGHRIPILSGLGSTETGPAALCSGRDSTRAGNVGLPLPGLELKLVPAEGRFEARLRGPNVTPGYWRQPELTRAAFDDEGFYRLGDAMHFQDAAAPEQGLVFDGRLAEDFKLATGTWVVVGRLRAQLLAALAPYAADVVVAGHDRDDLAVLIFPDALACRGVAEAELRAILGQRLESLARTATGSSNRVMRALLMDEPPSLDGHEVTDKGSLNQRAVLARRSALVEELYTEPFSARVIGFHWPGAASAIS